MGSGDLVTRIYAGFRGVDFRGNEVNLVRSPDALNVWKDYKEIDSIRTRPDIALDESYPNIVYGVFFYTVGNRDIKLVHSGTTLYKVENGERTALYQGLMPAPSQAFIYNNIWYFKDGINYLQYDGKNIGEVAGYVPTTSIGRKPAGGGTVNEDVNLLTGQRINTFLADGEAKEFYLDAQNIDSDFQPIVTVNGKNVTAFTMDSTKGMIAFTEAPPAPLTDGQDNVTIKFRKTVPGYRDRINKCTLLAVFDNRVFFSGNQDYPNTVFHSSLNEPGYCSDLDFYNEGLDLSPVRALVPGNNALWVFKEPSQANTTVFYHNPVIDAQYGKIYPSTHSSISTGCVAAGINFNDDIAFFSSRGMEAINGDVTTEQVIAHRSSLVDRKLTAEAGYKDMILEEWEGYLLVFIGNKVYLADSRAMFTNGTHGEYEWFYWELDREVTCTKVHDGQLYLGTTGGNNLLDLTQCGFARSANDNGVLKTDLENYYYSSIYFNYLNDFLMENRGKVFSVSMKEGIPGKSLSIIIYGTRADGSEWQEANSAAGGRACQIRVAADFETITQVEIRWNRSMTAFTDNETTTTELQFELGYETPYSPQHGLYTLSDLIGDVESYWVTPVDKFNNPQFLKTSNKRGCTVEALGDVTIYAKTNRTEWELIDTHDNVKDYFVSRIKRKKFKDIQLKFYTESRFSLESATLECFVGGYTKR